MEEHKGLACIGLVITVILLGVLEAIITGWALSVLWAWFVVPIFAVSKLTILQAYGLTFIVALFKRSKTSTTNDEKKQVAELLLDAFLNIVIPPLVLLAFGWIVVQFM